MPSLNPRAVTRCDVYVYNHPSTEHTAVLRVPFYVKTLPTLQSAASTRMKSESGGGESLDAAAVALGPMNRFMTYLRNNEKLHVAWCVTGIVGCLLLYGVLQV